MNENNYVAIMAGGIGSRFWPVSRLDYPKQFLDLLHVGKTLIQTTYDRFAQYIPLENIYVVTTRQYQHIVEQQLPKLKRENILGEPSRKNTAPCIAYVSYKLHQLNPKSNLICAPADHLILDETQFRKVTLEALEFTEKNNALITLGLKPHAPNTGYGYIQHDQYAVNDNVYKVKTFTEKPDIELAKQFLISGDFLWNAGIFVWRTESIIGAFAKHLPEIHELFDSARQDLTGPGESNALELIYPLCVTISIDYGILEKAENVYVIPSEFGWSDLGTWGGTYENFDKDGDENSVTGDNIILFDTRNNIVYSQNDRLLILQGLDDFIVVDTRDVLLICKKDKEQNIKEYVAEVKRNKGDRYL